MSDRKICGHSGIVTDYFNIYTNIHQQTSFKNLPLLFKNSLVVDLGLHSLESFKHKLTPLGLVAVVP